LKNFGNKEKQTPVEEQISETKTLVESLGINIEEQMAGNRRKKVESLIKKTFEESLKDNLASKSDLEAKGYHQVDLISTKDGFNIEKIFDIQTGKVKWSSTSIPTYIHNYLNEDVVLGEYEDNSDKIAIYTKS